MGDHGLLQRRYRWTAVLCGVGIVGAGLAGVSAGAAGATVPGTPTVISVKAGTRSITAVFTKPASNGGAPILTYQVRCTSSDGGVTGLHDGPHSPVRVGGLSHNKTYTCTVSARNHVGLGRPSAPSAAVVARPAAPAAPTITSVNAGNHSVTVAFTKPADDGGAPIGIYEAQCTSTNGGGTGRHNAATSPITVSGLAGNKTYTCTVAASNSLGVGSPSASSTPVMVRPTAPGAPTITSVKAGIRSITVAFTAPADNGGAPIVSDRAACTSTKGGVTRAHNAPTSPNRVAGLTGGATYTCTVAAGNLAGFGAASAASHPAVPRSH